MITAIKTKAFTNTKSRLEVYLFSCANGRMKELKVRAAGVELLRVTSSRRVILVIISLSRRIDFLINTSSRREIDS